VSRLFNADIAKPFNRVAGQATRRPAGWRLIITWAAALAAVAATLAASSAAAAGRQRTADLGSAASPPRYYFEEGLPSARAVNMRFVVRATASGSVTGAVHCPGPEAYAPGAAADGHQTFFVACRISVQRSGQLVQTGTRIYRFVVTRAGRVRGFRLLPGGNLAGLAGGSLAVTAEGTELAITAAPAKSGPASEVIVINTASGAHAIWHAGVLPGDLRLAPSYVSFADHGQVLAVFGFVRCAKSRAAARCKSPGEEMLAVTDARAGGQLAAGRKIFTQGQLVSPRLGWVNDAFISPNGSTAVAAVNSSTGPAVYLVSAATGRPVRVLYRSPSPRTSYGIIAADSSGRFILLDGQAVIDFKRQLINGWIDEGKLSPLEPQAGFIDSEAW